jgi:chromosome segregation protein
VSLSKLELIGFKSFMSPVTLNFREGITAILGPNGCGKTNIVDAVRWVLGEQSARQLRGAKMENVIFNGTQMHKPLGCAVVNMTVDNTRGVFPVDYSEIMITRKVYRSGISEYFINKSPCRLKDIKELFADTGTGSHSYAVIEQEMIEFVLNDAHGERRHMFEEASGIVKYRMRREEARRKLSLTETDLVRLDDILEELGKQVRALKYQVGKAKRYGRIKEKVRAGELILLRKNLSDLLAEKRDVDSRLSSILDVSRREDDSVSRMEREVESGKMELHDLEKNSTELQNKRYEIRREIQAAEEKVIQFTERRNEAEKRIERAELEITEAENRLEKISGRISAVNAECEELSIGTAGEEEVFERLDGEFKEVSERVQFVRSKLMELKQTQLDFLHDRARVKSSIDHYENMLSELATRAALMREEILRVEQAAKESATARDDGEKDLVKAQDLLASLNTERDGSLDSARAMEERLLEMERELSEKRTALARVKSKYDLLRRMSENFEGFTGGARFVLQKGDNRVKGPLAEFLDVDERFRPALEAVLGGMFDGVVVDSVRGAVDIMKELSEKDLGKVHFFVEKGWNGPDAYAADPVSGSLGMLSSHVQVKEPLKGMIVGLLGRVMVFEDDERAIQFLDSSDGGLYDAVTLSGTYFCMGKGIYYAGRSSDEASLLGRAERLDEMKSSITRLEKIVSDLSQICEADRGDRERLLENARSIEGKLTSAAADVRSKGETLKGLERDYILKKEKGAVLLEAFDELETSRSETLGKLEETKLALEMQKEYGDGAEADGLERELDDKQKHRDSIEEELTEKRVDLASRRGSLERKREEIRGLAEMEKQFRDIMSAREQERSSSRDEIAELTIQIEVERAKVKELLEGESKYQSDLDETNAALEEKRSVIAGMEKELKKRQTEREEFMARQNELKVKLSSIDTRMKDLVDRGREINREDLGCYLEGEEIPFTEEEMQYSPDSLEKEKRRLESIGPVNLAAVEEHEEKKNRLEFLLAQKEDLIKAKGELNEAIRKINKRARKQFTGTFEIVRRYFSEIFQVLFEGGEADLSLSGDGDPLEADVVITARPKGKRLQDISLLSGGERALTALSLLFALYKAKPSPFCIFDEVDAPLDDANIVRFVKMLEKFQDETQFVIITHNKRTMEVADSLFGITMEEKGVSRVVSVDMRDVEDVLANKRAAPQGLIEVPVSSN